MVRREWILKRNRIALNDEWLWVEEGRVSQFRLDPYRIRVDPPDPWRPVRLEANGVRVEVGRFSTERKRRELARDLRLVFNEQTKF